MRWKGFEDFEGFLVYTVIFAGIVVALPGLFWLGCRHVGYIGLLRVWLDCWRRNSPEVDFRFFVSDQKYSKIASFSV